MCWSDFRRQKAALQKNGCSRPLQRNVTLAVFDQSFQRRQRIVDGQLVDTNGII
jgi:hypothetical protein